MPVVLTALLFIRAIFIVLPTNAQDSQGPRWQEVPLQSGEVAEIVISPSNPNIMYAGFEVNSHSLYKSIDGGKSWTRINGGGDHTKDVAVSPRDPNRVYFAMSESMETTDLSVRSTAKSLYESGQRRGPPGFGQDSQLILSTGIPAGGSSVSFSSVEVFEGDDNILYASRKGGDYGPGGSSGITPIIYKTTNRGQNWSEVKVNLPTVNVIAIHPESHDTILVGSREGIYKSEDSGKTLSQLQRLPSTISLEFQISDPKIIYAASPSKALKSIDGEQSWKDITGNLKDIHRVRISRSNPNILYAATFNGVFRSDNGGSSWKEASGNLKAKNTQIVEIHPQNPDIAFVGHSSLWSSVRSEDRYKTGLLAHQGIFKTEDGGKTWARSDTGIKEYRFEEVAINPTKPYEAWVQSPASRGGYKTEDGGQNWRLSQTPTMHYPMRIKYSFQNKDTLYATGWQNGAPFSISSDGGVNWKFINEQIFFNGVTGGKELLKSERGGGAIHLHGLAVDPSNDRVVYAGSISDSRSPVQFPLKGAHIFKSEDGGNTWAESDEGFPHDQNTAIHDITVDPKNPSIIYVSTTRHESEKGIGVYKSGDGGKSWTASNSGLSGDDSLSVNALIINSQNTNEIVIATFGGLYKSEDGGRNWRRASSTSSFDAEYVIDSPNIVYASTHQGVLRSGDFGSTWTAFGVGLPAGEGHGIGVDKGGNVIYAAVENQGLFVAGLTDVPAKDPVSKFGSNPYGFGPFSGGGPFGESFGGEPSTFVKILVILVGLFVAIPLTIFGVVEIIKKRKGVGRIG